MSDSRDSARFEPVLEERLTTIETKIAFAEHAFEELNLTVYRQQQQIERLQQQIERLQQQILELRRQMEAAAAKGERLDPRDEIPPHY